MKTNQDPLPRLVRRDTTTPGDWAILPHLVPGRDTFTLDDVSYIIGALAGSLSDDQIRALAAQELHYFRRTLAIYKNFWRNTLGASAPAERKKFYRWLVRTTQQISDKLEQAHHTGNLRRDLADASIQRHAAALGPPWSDLAARLRATETVTFGAPLPTMTLAEQEACVDLMKQTHLELAVLEGSVRELSIRAQIALERCNILRAMDPTGTKAQEHNRFLVCELFREFLSLLGVEPKAYTDREAQDGEAANANTPFEHFVERFVERSRAYFREAAIEASFIRQNLRAVVAEIRAGLVAG